MTIRFAEISDVKPMLEIYSPYVLETSISFELTPPSIEDFQARLTNTILKYPWYVDELDGQITGYSYAGPFKSRSAYEWSVESSVYVRRGFEGRGIGRALYAKLLAILEAQGVVNVIGGITLPNLPSVKLHEKFGFVKVAHFKDAGFKCGQWWDVGYWQRQLQRPPVPQMLQPAIVVSK